MLQFCRAGDGVETLQLGTQKISGISKVQLLTTGQLLIGYASKKTNEVQGILVTEDQLPDAFLESWGIQRRQARLFHERFEQAELQKAISDGQFRQVDDTVYDLRQSQPDWIHFNNVKVVKVLKSHAVINIAPDTPGVSSLIYVRNYPPLPSGQDQVSFIAFRCHQTMSASPETLGHVFDFGKICKRADIPPLMLKGNHPNMKVEKERILRK